VVTVICVIGGITTTFAQDGNGISNPDSYGSDTSNWCDVGNVLGPEYCNNDDLAPSWWKYEFGWYWQRVTEGDISVAQVPEPYRGNVGLDSSDNGDGTVTITIQTATGPRTITIVLLALLARTVTRARQPLPTTNSIRTTSTRQARGLAWALMPMTTSSSTATVPTTLSQAVTATTPFMVGMSLVQREIATKAVPWAIP
jgi:hypothetical protein